MTLAIVHEQSPMWAGLAVEPADPADPAGPGALSALSSSEIRTICALRRDRDGIVPRSAASDAQWEIMLNLYGAHLDQRRMSISNLAAEVSIPSTSLLRAISHLCELGIVRRTDDPTDRRRSFIELSDDTIRKMAAYFRRSGTLAAYA